MISFLVDENVRRDVAEFLSSLGDVKYAPRNAPDAVVAKIAETEWRILITHDKDFANRLVYLPERYAGIVILRIHPPNPTVIINALSKLFSLYNEEALDGSLVLLGPEDFVINPLPGDSNP